MTRFGISFFSTVRPEQKPAERYFDEALTLAALADELGYSHVRTVEHYFRPYGGMTPSPIVFLTAVAARTRRVRLVTGAVLPIFNHPIKIAGETAMLDCISSAGSTSGSAGRFCLRSSKRSSGAWTRAARASRAGSPR